MRALIALCMVTAIAGCSAERERPTPSPAPERPGSDDALGALPDPGAVLDHQGALALDADQVRAIGDHLRTTQTALVDLEIRARAARETLRGRLASSPIDEPGAITAARELAAIETEIELAHLALRIRIANVLTPDQRARLTSL